MKVTVEVECTPIEARQFIGLPDITPLNESMVEEMTKRMRANIELMAPETMMRSWMALGGQAQEAFVNMLTASAGVGRSGRGG